MSKPSKQLGALLGGTPRATPSAAPVREPVTYATKAAASPAVREPVPVAAPDDEQETLLQVRVPMRVRRQLEKRHSELRKPLRTQVLEALRQAGIEVRDNDFADKRRRDRQKV